MTVPAYSAPYFHGITTGSVVSVAGTGTLSVPWPSAAGQAHQINDIGLLIVESGAASAVTLSTAAGFVEHPGSPVVVDDSRLHVFWCRATSAAMTTPVVTGGTDHKVATMICVRGAETVGNPWDVYATTAKTSASTTMTAPSVTTTVGRCLLLNIAAIGIDSTGGRFSSESGGGYDLRERVDNGATDGDGGVIGIWSSFLESAGVSGTVTSTISSSVDNAVISIAFKPPQLSSTGVVSPNATYSRLEGQVTIASSTTATVGAGTATITAGTYYPTTLMTEVATQFASASGTTCTITVGWGRNGTGLVTITFGVAKAIAWVTTALRDLLGFAGDSASATVHVGTLHARNVWLPNCPYQAPNAIGSVYRGWREADKRDVENAAGYVWSHMGQEKEVSWLKWPQVSRAKTLDAFENTSGESFERFCRDAIWGVASWGTPRGPVRFYPDADDTVYATYQVLGLQTYQPQPYFPQWVGGPHTIELPRLVVVPGT